MESLPTNYSDLLTRLRASIRETRLRAVVTVNTHLLGLYWNIRHIILTEQEKLVRGSRVIEQLSKDLKSEFPDMEGLSVRNLKYMRKFAADYSETSNVQQPVAHLMWSHQVILMDKAKDADERNF